MLSTKFAYPLLHIKPVGKQVAVCYHLVGWNVVYELDVIGIFLGGFWFLFVRSCVVVYFLVFSINFPISSPKSPIFRQRFEFRCSTPFFELSIRAIWMRRLMDNVEVRIFMDRFELSIRAIWLRRLMDNVEVRIF